MIAHRIQFGPEFLAASFFLYSLWLHLSSNGFSSTDFQICWIIAHSSYIANWMRNLPYSLLADCLLVVRGGVWVTYCIIYYVVSLPPPPRSIQGLDMDTNHDPNLRSTKQHAYLWNTDNPLLNQDSFSCVKHIGNREGSSILHKPG